MMSRNRKGVLVSVAVAVFIVIVCRSILAPSKVVKDDGQWRGLWKDPREYAYKTTFNTEFIRVYPEQGTGFTVDISKHFDFDIFNAFCRSSGHLKAILPIYSSADRAKTRNILRDTLGKLALKLKCKIFFIVGVSLNENVNTRIQKEYVDKKDILMVGKIDTYRDLNNKAMAMLNWISRHCADVTYVIHLIDDAFIDLPAILKHLDGIKTVNYVFGRVHQPDAPRNELLKTFVTKEDYPYDIFPLYALGFAYAFPRNVTELLLSAAHTAPYCWIEDVWLMGHVRIAANVTAINTPQQHWFQHEIKPEEFEYLYSQRDHRNSAKSVFQKFWYNLF